eukprot:scaffold14086_cov193-Skeletonema_dohrnii-CCMP3373.AAC.1
MICSGDVDISDFLDTDVNVAQAISDGGYNSTGTTTFDINAAAYVEDDDPMIDEAIEMMTLAIHAAEGKDEENADGG